MATNSNTNRDLRSDNDAATTDPADVVRRTLVLAGNGGDHQPTVRVMHVPKLPPVEVMVHDTFGENVGYYVPNPPPRPVPDAVLLCFAIDNRDSLDDVQRR
ncbi:hypothetical protein HK405_000889, partial [Cladochytrium tenue]